MTTSESEIRKPGRPRSAQAHQAILDATLALLAEEGFGRMSIEAVAERAGVGKTTIYRRWSSKLELTIDAIRSIHSELPVVDTGNLRTNLITMFHNAMQSSVAPMLVKSGLCVIDEIMEQPEALAAMQEGLFAPRLQAFCEMVDQAKARGELQADVDTFLLMDLLAGPFIFRMFTSSLLGPPPPDWPEKVIDAILNGIGLGGKTLQSG